MKNINKLELALLPLIIIFIIISIGCIGVLFYITWFIFPIHWIFKLLISIFLIYFIYLGKIMGDIRTEEQFEFLEYQYKKLKEKTEKGE